MRPSPSYYIQLYYYDCSLDGPAWQLLQPRDAVLSVNDVDVSDAEYEDVIKLIKYVTKHSPIIQLVIATARPRWVPRWLSSVISVVVRGTIDHEFDAWPLHTRCPVRRDGLNS